MKRVVLSLAAVAASAAAPAAAETVFVGGATIRTVTTQCGSAATVGDYGRLIYRPASPGLDNGADSYLAFVFNRAAYAMTVPNNTFRINVNYAGQGVGSTLNVSTKTGGITQWTLSPATLAATTPSTTLTATLANFWAITGCTVTFNAYLIRVKSNATDVVN